LTEGACDSECWQHVIGWREGGSRGSSWWRELGRIHDGVGDLGGGWFRESVQKKMRDDTDTLF
jgi:hypothetical protein